jgi:hypothetical protein
MPLKKMSPRKRSKALTTNYHRQLRLQQHPFQSHLEAFVESCGDKCRNIVFTLEPGGNNVNIVSLFHSIKLLNNISLENVRCLEGSQMLLDATGL